MCRLLSFTAHCKEHSADDRLGGRSDQGPRRVAWPFITTPTQQLITPHIYWTQPRMLHLHSTRDLRSNMASLSIADNAAPTAPVRPATTSQQLSVWARGLAWARGTTTSTIDYTVAHGPDLVACAVDSCAVVGVGEDAAHRAQIAAPWFLRILSTYAPSYQMEKGITYLDEAFDMLQQNGREMPLKVSKKLLKTYNLYVIHLRLHPRDLQ